LLHIDHSRCAGCALCVDACPTGAIHMDQQNRIAVIDPTLCAECLACVQVCPTGAIQQVPSPALVPTSEAEVVEGEIIGRQVVPVASPTRPLPAQAPGALNALAGAAKSIVGNWLLPRADALLDAAERRLASTPDRAARTGSLRAWDNPRSRQAAGTRNGRGRQRRRRRRWR